MNFEALQRRVQRAERLVDRRATRTQQNWAALKLDWRAGWTPWRIVAAGLIGGFLTGSARPLRTADGVRLMQMLSAVSTLFATVASEAAADAAQSAEATADAAQPPADAAPEPVAPRPAEAATELSEH